MLKAVLDKYEDYAETENFHDFNNKIEELKKTGDVEVSQHAKLKSRITFEQGFVIAFTDNLVQFAELNISQNELKVVVYILQKMEYGNLISIKQSAIAGAINLDKAVVSRVFKKLHQKGILIKDEEGNEFVNSNLFAKGISTKMKKEKLDKFRKTQVENDLFKSAYIENKKGSK